MGEREINGVKYAYFALIIDEMLNFDSSSPKWTPGRQRDRAVKVTYTFPVIFQLR